MPNDLGARNELRDLLLGVMDALVAIGELVPQAVGAAFDVPCPPSANIIYRGEDCFGSLVYREGGREV
jgi:hypothetical protein